MRRATTCGGSRAWMELLLLALLLLPGIAQSQTKQTFMVPMRDGTRLATDVLLPAGNGPFPVALARTPYGREALQPLTSIPLTRLATEGIALVVQDVRGRFGSEGVARLLVDDAWGDRQDGADTIAWIRGQSWSNGRIATFGASYVGMTQLLLAGAGPQGIVGQYVAAAPLSQYHSTAYPNGVFRPALVEEFIKRGGFPADNLALIRQHPSYDDYWRTQDLSTRLDQVRWPIVHVGGWFDVVSQGTINAWMQLQQRGGGGAQGSQYLVIGPWVHTGLGSRVAGDLVFPENATAPPGAPTELQWLLAWLKGAPAIPSDEPAVRYYVMGAVDDPQAPGNSWRSATTFPPPAQTYSRYFTAEGGLEPQPAATASTREYDYDPAKPVPTVGGAELISAAGPRDQRSVENRPDVLVFTSAPLAAPVEMTGRVRLHLSASSSARDTDFTAKLCDVYPDGRSILILDSAFRTRFRLSLSEPTSLTPGEVVSYDLDMGFISLVFNQGHRIRVAISSSNSPRFEPNPNTWPEINRAAIVARQKIIVGGVEPSFITLPQFRGGG